MKVYDLAFIPDKIYMKIIEDFPCSMLTDAIHNEIGLKYYCTESNKFAELGETKQYLFEVIDPKKLILSKLKYGF